MKKIGIDARLYSQTGVGTYIQNLLFYLDKKNRNDTVYYIYILKDDIETAKSDLKNGNFVFRQTGSHWHSFSEQTDFLLLLLRDNLDLMHFTYFSYPVLYKRKFIATVHDTTPLFFKTGRASTKNPVIYQIKHFIFRLVLSMQVAGALRIITPAKSVGKDLVRVFGKKYNSKIVTIYEGIPYKITAFNPDEKSVPKKTGKPYFLYVGNFYPHKNVENLIVAFKNIPLSHELKLIGPDGFFTERLANFINGMNMNGRVEIIKNPPTSSLINYYRNSAAVICPSYSEGFGLPLAEAAYLGKTIIASDIPVFRELWDSRYLSFDPKNPADIAAKIRQFIDEKPVYDHGNILKKFSFEEMTEETIRIYEDVLNS